MNELILENKYNCSKNIWRKFSEEEKRLYNILRELMDTDFDFHTEIVKHPKKKEIMDVTAHNISCDLVWSRMIVLKNKETV
jgi:hypothetical protein